MEGNSHYLELDKHVIRFDPVSAVNNVFYDDANTQIFAVRSGGETGVVVRGPDPRSNVTFRLQDKGQLISIKFSYQHQILAIQRSDNTICFANFSNGIVSQSEYIQQCKGKNNSILTFHWLSSEEIVVVTRHGIEYYTVNAEKRSVKLLKHFQLSINWSIFSPESAVLLCSTGATGSLLVPFHFKNSQVVKLVKFDVDRANKNEQMDLQEKDVTLLNLYGNLYAAVLRHPVSETVTTKAQLNLHLLSSTFSGKPTGTPMYVDLYFWHVLQLNIKGTEVIFKERESPAKMTHLLHIGMTGRFAVNILDSLIVVHHQLSKVSLVFDIKIPDGSSTNDGYKHVRPIVVPMSIKPCKAPDSGTDDEDQDCELYSPTWIVFQPNIIIDAAIGCMWFLKLKLKTIATLFDDMSVLIDFLQLRSVSKPVLLKVIKQAVMSESKQVPLQIMTLIFNKLNKVYKEFLDAEDAYLLSRKLDSIETTNSGSLPPLYPSHRLQVVIDQSDMYTNILSLLAEQTDVQPSYVGSVLWEYIRSLHKHSIPIKTYLEELLIKTMLNDDRGFQIEQLLQNNVLQDSKHLAACLVRFARKFPEAYEYALQMYERLTSCSDEIVDILLLQGKVTSGLRVVRSAGIQDSVSARKFLESANKIDRIVFYQTYKFFESRNLRLRGTKDFKPGELCDEYVQLYKEEFT